MKKFIIKSILFACIIVTIIEICNWGYMRQDPYGTNQYKNMPDKIDVCNFGSSHSRYAFNYEDVENDIGCVNFGNTSQSHIYDYLILQAYEDKLTDGGVAFITVSYHDFLGYDEIDDASFKSKNCRYYNFLPKEYIREYDSKTDMGMKLAPCLYAGSLKDIIIGLLNYHPIITWEIQTTKEEVSEKAQLVAQSHIERFDENGNRVYNQQEIDSLYKIIELCKNKNVTPVLITTPFAKEYTDAIKSLDMDYYNEFHEIIEKIQADTQVEYLDFSEDERFCEKYEWFIDSNHLNKYGAREFTNMLLSEYNCRDGLK